ncbi:MAG: hypothetical protein M1829_004182 [Trizodia sp. TS-e1964]|nr:MAG: hypothetical protein M1829_004182 [Trizodia sp. TS-e1964]
MDRESLSSRVRGLGDLELAALLCLVASEHCIIETNQESLEPLCDELQQISSNTFGLTSVVVDCSESTTVDEFVNALFVEEPYTGRTTPFTLSAPLDHSSFQSPPIRPQVRALSRTSLSLLSDALTDDRKLANVIIAKNIDLSDARVQIQALELLRNRRILTHTAAHTAPSQFLFVALLSGELEDSNLVSHLNDFMFISHFHSIDEDFPEINEGDGGSISSVVRKSQSGTTATEIEPLFSSEDIEKLASEMLNVAIHAEVKRYMQNIIVYLRLHRAVAGGISPRATKHFDKLVRCLAPLNSLNYVTPSLVALAARKTYPHRIEMVSPENERSMQWGSDLGAITVMLESVAPRDVVDEVLNSVEVPL